MEGRTGVRLDGYRDIDHFTVIQVVGAADLQHFIRAELTKEA